MNIKFARGWLLSPCNMAERLSELPEYYSTKTINQFYDFSHDSILDFNIHKDGDKWLIFIGLAYDIENINRDAGEICASLARNFSFAEPLKKCFLNTLDNMAGRFVVLCISGEKVHVFNDCNGMQPVYYHQSRDVIASHYGLVNLLCPEELVNDFSRYTTAHQAMKMAPPVALQGDLTPYKNIYTLVPNNTLELPLHKLTRYFPLEEPVSVNYHDVGVYIGDTLKSLCERVNQDYKIFMSLTFGYDSRTSLSAVRHIRDNISFFTYYYSEAPKHGFLKYDSHTNRNFSVHASKILGLNLKELDLSSFQVTESQRNDFNTNYYNEHQLPEVLAYEELFQENRSVHLRSNVYEMLKYNLYHISPNYNKRQVAAYLSNYNFVYARSPIYKEIFDYYLTTYIDKYNVMDLVKSGYNYGDIFYMEHRNAQWLSGVILENDPATQTFLPIDCRKLIQLAMSVPKQLKDRDVLQNAIIAHNWPILLNELKYPNNPERISHLADYEIYRDRQNFCYKDYVNDSLNFSVTSYNPEITGRKDFHYLKANFDNIVAGFSNLKFIVGDTVDIGLVFPVEEDKNYYLSFSIYTAYLSYLDTANIEYKIFINETERYSIGIRDFYGINKFDHLFKSKNNGILKLNIKLITNENLITSFANSLIKINNIIFRPETKFGKEDYFTSSLDALKRRMSPSPRRMRGKSRIKPRDI